MQLAHGPWLRRSWRCSPPGCARPSCSSACSGAPSRPRTSSGRWRPASCRSPPGTAGAECLRRPTFPASWGRSSSGARPRPRPCRAGDRIMALMPTDLPEPVVPATSTCGILARSATTGLPSMSLPRPMVSRRLALVVDLRAQHLASGGSSGAWHWAAPAPSGSCPECSRPRGSTPDAANAPSPWPG